MCLFDCPVDSARPLLLTELLPFLVPLPTFMTLAYPLILLAAPLLNELKFPLQSSGKSTLFLKAGVRVLSSSQVRDI